MKRKHSVTFFVILTSPIFICAIIKEHFALLSLYIGLILISLIFISTIFEKKLKQVFIQSHLNLLNSLILQMRSGYSTQKAVNDSIAHMTHLENMLFEPIKTILTPDFDVKATPFSWMWFYLSELRLILKSETRVVDQLEVFKQGLKVKNRFSCRTQQVTRQIKAQAMVSCLVYGLIFALSYYQLSLMDSFLTVLISGVLFLTGITIIFKFGGRIKWTV